MSIGFKKLLDHPTKKVDEATGELAKLFRLILADLNIKELEFERLFIAWYSDPRNKVPRIGKAIASERGNIMKEFEKEDMTWKVFLKGIRFLRPRMMSIRITLDWNDPRRPNGGQTVHELKFPVANMNTTDD